MQNDVKRYLIDDDRLLELNKSCSRWWRI